MRQFNLRATHILTGRLNRCRIYSSFYDKVDFHSEQCLYITKATIELTDALKAQASLIRRHKEKSGLRTWLWSFTKFINRRYSAIKIGHCT